jgi:carbon monoxide dehydrogenase subunit G
MARVTRTLELDAPVEAVRPLVADAEPFTAAGGFDDVTVDGDRMHLENRLGLATVELDLRLRDDDVALSYEQVDGMFEEMWTTYEVEAEGDGSVVTATTEFALTDGVLGDVLDATIIRRQRGREIDGQFEYLREQLGE